MELIERIISKVVGKEITVEEQQEVAGGRIDVCLSDGGYYTPREWGSVCDYN
jgi:hypothetical protein